MKNNSVIVHGTVVHEFFHLVQANYDWHDLGGNSWQENLGWLEEGINIWEQDEIYDDEKTDLGWINAFFENPDVKLTFPGDKRTYKAGIYWRFLSEHYQNSSDTNPGWWIIRKILQQVGEDNPQTSDGVTNSVTTALTKFAEVDGTDNDGIIDETGEGVGIFNFEKTFVRTDNETSTFTNLSPSSEGPNSYFTRANYLNVGDN